MLRRYVLGRDKAVIIIGPSPACTVPLEPRTGLFVSSGADASDGRVTEHGDSDVGTYSLGKVNHFRGTVGLTCLVVEVDERLRAVLIERAWTLN